MRLRNIPRAESVLSAHPLVMQDAAAHRGQWSRVFGNEYPVRVEIGMGKGQFLLECARCNPQVNWIGVERYSSVLLRATEKVDRLLRDELEANANLMNIRFLCADARGLGAVFAPGEIDRLYLNFSDPWPKDRHRKRRLTSRQFLSVYRPLIREDGCLEFKTDNRTLFDFSVEEISGSALFVIESCTYDLHNDPDMSDGNIMTEYEEKFSARGNPICKLVARVQGESSGL